MTKQTEALRMAIEVIEAFERGCDIDDYYMDVSNALDACKEALAETQEPMTHVIGLDNDGKEVVVKLQTPLYTTPPSREWQSLSDEEILECLSKTKWNDIDYCPDHDDFASHIEAKLREKNG